MYWWKSLGEKYMGEESLGKKYIGQESLGEKSEKPVEEESLGEESLGEKYINLKVLCLFLHQVQRHKYPNGVVALVALSVTTHKP